MIDHNLASKWGKWSTNVPIFQTKVKGHGRTPQGPKWMQTGDPSPLALWLG